MGPGLQTRAGTSRAVSGSPFLSRDARAGPRVSAGPPVRRRGKTPRAPPPGKAAPRRFSSIAGARGAHSRPAKTRDPTRASRPGSNGRDRLDRESSSSLFVHIAARSFARVLRKLRTTRHRPIQGFAWRRRVLSGLWCAVAHCVDSTPSHKKRLSCQWRSPGIDEPTTGVPPATRLQWSAARLIDGRHPHSRGKRLISSSSTPPRTTRDLARNSQPVGAGDQRPLFSATLLRPWRPAFRPTPLPAEEDW